MSRTGRSRKGDLQIEVEGVQDRRFKRSTPSAHQRVDWVRHGKPRQFASRSAMLKAMMAKGEKEMRRGY